MKESKSWKDLARKLGYSNSPSGDTIRMLKEKFLYMDTSHLDEEKIERIQRNPENIFIENSTASQRTLRSWYKKGNYTPYKCSICGMEPFWQGKELTLILDHINGQNHDDRLENLRWVCPNCNQQLDTTGSRNIKKENAIKKFYCVDCGKEISFGSIRCNDCSSKYRKKNLSNIPISRDELKEDIRTMSFVDIGKKFGLSDNAIRKWCDKLNLPRKKRDIMKYTDEEWKKI